MINKTAFDGNAPIALESAVGVTLSATATATQGTLDDAQVGTLMSSRVNYIDFQRGSITHHELFSLDTDAHSEGYLTYCHCERESGATRIKTITVNLNNNTWSLAETEVGGGGKKYVHYIGIHQYNYADEADDVYITAPSSKATPYTFADICQDFAGVTFPASGFTSGGMSVGGAETNSIITRLVVSSTAITLYMVSYNGGGSSTIFSGEQSRAIEAEYTTITDVVKEV